MEKLNTQLQAIQYETNPSTSPTAYPTNLINLNVQSANSNVQYVPQPTSVSIQSQTITVQESYQRIIIYSIIIVILFTIMVMLFISVYRVCYLKHILLPPLPYDLEQHWKDETLPIYVCTTPIHKKSNPYSKIRFIEYDEVSRHMAISWTHIFYVYDELSRKNSSLLRKTSLSLKKGVSLGPDNQLHEYTPSHPLLFYDMISLHDSEYTQKIINLFPGTYLFSRMVRSNENPLIVSFVLTENTWVFPRSYRIVMSNDYDYMFQVKSNAPELRIINHLDISTYKDYPKKHPLYDTLIQNTYDIRAYEEIQMDDISHKNFCQLLMIRSVLEKHKKAVQLKNDVEWLDQALENPNYKII
jgi:hypothetical protein